MVGLEHARRLGEVELLGAARGPGQLGHRFEDVGVAALLFTDVGRDGLLKGCNVEATTALAAEVSIPVIASGGVAGIADIHALVGRPGTMP